MPRGKPGAPVVLRETEYLAEYLSTKYPRAKVVFQPRLGAYNPDQVAAGLTAGELRMLGVWRRYPDAAVFLSDRVVLIEASLKPDPGKISILNLYARLFPLTPEMDQYRSLPVEKLLVWALHDHAAEALARESGIRVEVYQPQWVLDWLDSMRPRDRRAPQITA